MPTASSSRVILSTSQTPQPYGSPINLPGDPCDGIAYQFFECCFDITPTPLNDSATDYMDGLDLQVGDLYVDGGGAPYGKIYRVSQISLQTPEQVCVILEDVDLQILKNSPTGPDSGCNGNWPSENEKGGFTSPSSDITRLGQLAFWLGIDPVNGDFSFLAIFDLLPKRRKIMGKTFSFDKFPVHNS
jgi:hypothetical protein